MGGAMKYFLKKLLGLEIFRSMVSWATNFFFEKSIKPSDPPCYILNVQSLKMILNIWVKKILDLVKQKGFYTYD